MYSDTLLNYVSNNLINIDNINMTKYNKKKPEIIVDFNEDPYGKILININYNTTGLVNSKKSSTNLSSTSR